MTHKEQISKVKPAVPCNANHTAIGGGCFNCLWEPEERITDGKLYARRFDDTLERFDVSKGYLTITKV